MPFEKLVELKHIDRKHSEWSGLINPWTRMSLLYAGGYQIQAAAEEFLLRRPKELSDIYNARVARFTYTNHVGTAVDYYQAALFETPPTIEPRTMNGTTSDQVDSFYNDFQANCDGLNTTLVEAFRKVLKNLLVYQRCFILTDLPSTLGTARSKADEKELQPYIRIYDPRHIINWSTTPRGELDWAILKLRQLEAQPFEQGKIFDRWYVYDRINYAVYQREVPPDERIGGEPETAKAELVREGKHALARQEKVPLHLVDIPDGMWLMNRALLPAIDHLNSDNVLAWALHMSALAMPIITSDEDFTPTLSEAGYIKLPSDAKYQWSEPEGHSLGHLAEREYTLTENIYRAFYLIAQARSQNSTPTAQSGLSKQQDMAPSKKMLGMFGDILQAVIQSTLNRVSAARGDELSWDVRGLEFPEDTPLAEVDVAAETLNLDIPSETFEKELYKKLADTLFPDINPDTRQKIRKEIDEAATKRERDLIIKAKEAEIAMKVNKQNAPQATEPANDRPKPGRPIPKPKSRPKASAPNRREK